MIIKTTLKKNFLQFSLFLKVFKNISMTYIQKKYFFFKGHLIKTLTIHENYLNILNCNYEREVKRIEERKKIEISQLGISSIESDLIYKNILSFFYLFF